MPVTEYAKPAKGWAVVADGRIDMRTVGDNRRAAIVKWLATRFDDDDYDDGGSFVAWLHDASNEDVEDMWDRLLPAGADVVLVETRLMAGSP